ncbi:MAG: DUF4258 domain-containing protein [Dehalococcoidia bacterium]|nr:DUF4258 domain-containing protein [Dehalococcoidia bacterium]
MDIILTDHASYQMRRRRITMEDIRLILDLGQHSEGEEEQTMEACAEIDGRPITVIYDELDHRFRDIFRVITVIRKRCRE